MRSRPEINISLVSGAHGTYMHLLLELQSRDPSLSYGSALVMAERGVLDLR